MPTTTETYSYFGQNALIEVMLPGEDTYQSFAAIQKFGVETTFELENLYAMGTIRRVDVARHTAEVKVTCEYGKFYSPTQDWYNLILDPNWVAGSNSSSIADTTNVARFKFTAALQPTDPNGPVMYLTVFDVAFSNFPVNASLGEWIFLSLEGTGSNIEVSAQAPVGWVNPSSPITWSPDSISITGTATQQITLTGTVSDYSIKFGTMDVNTATVTYTAGSTTATVQGVAAGTTYIAITIDGDTSWIPVTVTGGD